MKLGQRCSCPVRGLRGWVRTRYANGAVTMVCDGGGAVYVRRPAYWSPRVPSVNPELLRLAKDATK